jgi:outer membrane biosynthesis protein TonB
MSESELEKKNKKKALLYTTIIQVVLFVVLFFIVAWRAPDPPIPEYGIELNFGMDDQGSGNIQPQTPVGNAGQAQVEPEQSQPEAAEEVPVEPEVEEEVVEEEVKPVEPQPTEQQVVSKVESPVVTKEKKEDPKPIEKPVEKKPEPKVVEKPKIEEKKEEKKVEEKPTINPDAVYKPKANQGDATSKSTDTKAGKPGNHGDDAGTTGDKGDPKGTLDAKSLYGKPGGGGGGSSLDLAGWDWDEIPKPNVPNNISGKIVFEITVDENGELINYRAIENSLTPEAAKACRDAVERLTFTKTGTNVPNVSKGKITFVVRAN